MRLTNISFELNIGGAKKKVKLTILQNHKVKNNFSCQMLNISFCMKELIKVYLLVPSFKYIEWNYRSGTKNLSTLLFFWHYLSLMMF